MPWISNHKHKIKEKSTKSSRSSSKVVGLRPADLWEFPTLLVTLYVDIDLVQTMAQVMTCCLMAPSPYLNYCWPITKAVLWHSMDRFVCAPNQWEPMLQCNVSHWLGAYTKWSLNSPENILLFCQFCISIALTIFSWMSASKCNCSASVALEVNIFYAEFWKKKKKSKYVSYVSVVIFEIEPVHPNKPSITYLLTQPWNDACGWNSTHRKH